MSRPASVGIAARGASGATTRSRPVSARSDCKIATKGKARRARGIGLSSTSNWRIVIAGRVVLAGHLRERSVGLDEGVEGLKVLVDLLLCLLREAVGQRLRKSFLGDLRQIDS